MVHVPVLLDLVCVVVHVLDLVVLVQEKVYSRARPESREGREFRVLGSKMRRPADSEFPGGNRDREAGNSIEANVTCDNIIAAISQPREESKQR